MSSESFNQNISVDNFIRDFANKKENILIDLQSLKPSSDGDLSKKVASLHDAIKDLNKSLLDASFNLPPYLAKVRQDEIRSLETLLKDKEKEVLPRKKFGFKSKYKAPESKQGSNLEPKSVLPSVENKDDVNSNFFTIENLENTTVKYEDTVLNRNDVLVRNLKNCVIYLLGTPSTLRILNLENCKLFCGPVYTSVFVEGCNHSTLYLCCQQLRTHNSTDIDVYLKVKSRAIIEDSSKVRFGPYNWDYLNKDMELFHQRVSIDPKLERYDAVDDFNWLSSSSPSPNWSIIPESERTGLLLPLA